MAAGWQDQLDRRRGSGRQGGSPGLRPSETSLSRRTAASFCAFLDRPTMGDQTSSSCPPPPQSPGFSPMPTLQPAHLAAQRKNGTPRPRRDCRPTWQRRANKRRAIQHSGAASCAPQPVATGHSTPGPGSTAAGGPQPGQEGTAEASAATNQNSRPMNVFLPRTNQTSTSKTHHQQPFREPWNLATSPALAALRSWLLASQSMQLPRVHTRPRETQVRINRETPPHRTGFLQSRAEHRSTPDPGQRTVGPGPQKEPGHLPRPRRLPFFQRPHRQLRATWQTKQKR